jgi:hypothetical protein
MGDRHNSKIRCSGAEIQRGENRKHQALIFLKKKEYVILTVLYANYCQSFIYRVKYPLILYYVLHKNICFVGKVVPTAGQFIET